jgi:hypothetical protein
VKHRRRLTVEALEDRWCPAITASFSNGLLTVTGTAVTNVTVKETAPAAIEIDDGSTVLYGSGGANPGFTSVNSIKLNLTAPNVVNVDLGGNTLAGNLSANLGNGANTMSVVNGTISGRLSVRGGTGADAVTLGSAGKTLAVSGETSVRLGGQTGDSLSVLGGVTLSHELETSAATVTLASASTVDELEAQAASVTLSAGSTVNHDVYVSGGSAGTTVDAEGKIGGYLVVVGGYYKGNQTMASSLTIGAAASVGGSVAFYNAYSNANPSKLTTAAGSSIGGNLYYNASGQGDTVVLGGSVGSSTKGGYVDLDMRNGTNTVTVQSTAVIAKKAEVEFGNGTNSLTFGGTVGQTGNTNTALFVTAGTGNNTVTLLGSTVVNGSATVNLGNKRGAGVNTLDLRDAATITGTLTANGGGNAQSTFKGSVQPNNHPTLAVTGFPIVQSGRNP